ncbi:hypothetical protein [Tuwongella immobilis]|uniref:Uncharacterized protein n=1 Tax=Tuwongella immobilis TaxID=692036 RepID=A0A6C2YK70_9BACT|nr:hypothetical protein [Tuwongella immobilis]VIP01503.1 unnamed protein product [Tuwongella immobilis]VTR98601.1 unnamed protein product [Tuwongella immobilis]
MSDRLPVSLTILHHGSVSQLSTQIQPDDLVATLLRQFLHLEVGNPVDTADWFLLWNGQPLDPQRSLRAQLPSLLPDPLELVVVHRDQLSQTTQVEIRLPEPTDDEDELSAPADDGDVDADFDESADRSLAPSGESSKSALPPSLPAPMSAPMPARPAPKPIAPAAPAPAPEPAPAVFRSMAPESAASEPEFERSRAPARKRAAAPGGPPVSAARAEISPVSVAEEEAITAPPPLETPRQAGVRYYRRMNPMRVYPMLVKISPQQIQAFQSRKIAQATSETFTAATGTILEIEPVLPGCQISPPRQPLRITDAESSLTFYVVPQVLGEVTGATVNIRNGSDLITTVPLDVTVRQRTWVLISGILAFVLPLISMLLKHFGLDFETQSKQDFGLYWTIARVLFDWLSPVMVAIIAAGITALLYLTTRPSEDETLFAMPQPETGR